MKYVFGILLMLSLFAISCKQDPEAVTTKFVNKTIKEINGENIITDEKKVFHLDKEKVAKVYYFIRHAETDTTNIANDQKLSKQGEQRAVRLANLFANTRLDAVYSNLSMRSLFTVDSLCDLKKIKTLPYDEHSLRTMLSSIQGDNTQKSVLVVGNFNTIPMLANEVYGKKYFNKIMDIDEYNSLYVVVKQKDSTNIILPLKY